MMEVDQSEKGTRTIIAFDDGARKQLNKDYFKDFNFKAVFSRYKQSDFPYV